MTVETDLSCEVSEGSGSEKVEWEEKSGLKSSLCDDQERDDDVDEVGDENVCESGDSEVKEESEGENGAYVMVGGGGDVHENVEHVEQEEGELESNEEKEVDIVEHEDTLENEEELHGEITGNVEASGEEILSLEGEAEPVDDDGRNASVVDDDENVEIVDDEEKIDKNDGDDEKVENVNDVETNGNEIDNVDAVEKLENVEDDEKIENVDHDDKIEGMMKPEVPVEVKCLPSESNQVDELNAVQKVDEGESDLVAEIKGNQQIEKSESFEEEVEKQVSQVMVSQNFEFEEIEDDVIVKEFSPPPPTKEDDVKLDMDTYVEDADSIRKIGDSERTPHESSEVTDEEVKEDVDSSYVFIDGTEAVSIESLEAKPVIGDMTSLVSVTQTEETQFYPHALLIGTLACGLPHYVPRALQPLNESSTKVSPSCSVVDNAKPGIGMANFFPDQSEYLPTGSSSDLESNEAVITIGDVYLESEEGTSSNRSKGESTPSSYGGTSDEKNGNEKEEKKSIFRYLIRVPRYFDDEIEEQIVHAQQQVDEMTRKRDAIREEIQAKKATCNVYRDKIEAAKQEEGVAYDARYVKRQELESVQSMLNMINSAFMVEEIGDQIRRVQHRIEHETIPLKEEKQLIRELKQLKSQHQQLRSNLHKKAETQPAIDQKEALEKRFKLLKEDLDSVRNEILRTEEITNAARKVFCNENEKLRNMQEQFRSADVLRQEAYACVQKLKKQLYEKNKYFRVYKDDARKAEEYKFTGDKEALNSHCVNQVEKVMELWNKNDDFRNEYVRLNRRSTWRRLHTSKVLSLGPDEPFIPWKVREKVVATRSSTVSTLGQGNSESPFEQKRTEEKSTVKQNQNHQTIPKKETIQIVLENDAAIVSGKVEAEEKTEEASKQTEEEKELAMREEETAAAQIREQLLVEEKAKAKEAEERKRRNAEKVQTRAELKAQKEAEQKEKERAKRERKKARKNAMKGTNENEPSVPSSEPTMPEPTIQEPEVEEKPPKTVSKRNQRPSVLAKQAKAKIAPPPLRNKNKKKMQPWIWVLMALIVVAAVYVVYMGSATNEDPTEIFNQNHKLLTKIHQGSTAQAKASHVYSYMHGFKGFAAKLTEEQAMKVAGMPGVVSVFQNTKRKLHTTHSWDFMGLPPDEATPIQGHSTKNQKNVIIGFIDTGIWPESASFSDRGMPPVPLKWKGRCQIGQGFNASSCNRKVIGARYYKTGYEVEEDSVKPFSSPRDSSGHGSHTASTAAGRYVPNVNYNGLGNGRARGGVPMARIAVYKSCWDSGCFDVDILAAFDDAIKDGVHILSLSLGPQSPQGDYFNDAVSIGSFHAARHGIMVVSSAGNEGALGSATNLAPWMFTVGASSTDRDFTSDIALGDGTKYKGESLSLSKMNNFLPIISASKANAGYFTPYQSSYCVDSSLNRTKTAGKILVCRHSGSSSESKLEKSKVVKDVGGAGMILIDDADKDIAVPFVIPAAIVGTKTGETILSYANHTRKPTARIFAVKTVVGSQPAPRITSFSSKGPNSRTPEILKPDVAAPGLNILAAWSPANNKLKFNVISGTSMSCPHVTGITALVKAVYPRWSSSAIKSAIMTTATMLGKNGKPITVDPDGRRGNPFDYGSGFVNPLKVLNPGLVYETQPGDYEAFLCSIGYDEKLLRLITGDNSTCSRTFRSASDLNYPSITVPDLKHSYSVKRTVTNVGQPRSIYRAVVSAPNGIGITVVPDHLSFNASGQKIKYTVNFKVTTPSKGYVFGSLTWRNGDVRVTSPLVVRVRHTDVSLSR